MNHRERVKKAFHFDKPDRIPKIKVGLSVDFFANPLVEPKSFQPKEYPPHILGGPNGYRRWWLRRLVFRYKWKSKNRKNLGLPRKWWTEEKDNQILTIDEWGLIWKSGAADRDLTMGHPYKGPFTDSWDNLDTHEFPDPHDKSRYRFYKFPVKLLGWRRYLIGYVNLLVIHNLASNLRGFSQMMVDFIKNPKKVQQLIDRITDVFYTEIPILKEKCPKLDAMMFFDDLGTQHSPFISPKLFRKFYYEPYKKIIDLTHDLGMDVILHSCGQIKELLPTFIDLGIDVLEFDSPNMTGVENFKEYAEQQKMAFWLSSNIQSTFSRGTPQEIEDEIKYYVREVGNNQGGLGFYKYLDHRVLKVPRENLNALDRAMKKWGNYNKQGIIDWLV
jgi:hypothetical protein